MNRRIRRALARGHGSKAESLRHDHLRRSIDLTRGNGRPIACPVRQHPGQARICQPKGPYQVVRKPLYDDMEKAYTAARALAYWTHKPVHVVASFAPFGLKLLVGPHKGVLESLPGFMPMRVFQPYAPLSKPE